MTRHIMAFTCNCMSSHVRNVLLGIVRLLFEKCCFVSKNAFVAERVL